MWKKEKGEKAARHGRDVWSSCGLCDLPITPPASQGLHCYSSHIPLNTNSGIKTGKMCLPDHFWKVLVCIEWIIHQIFHHCHCPSCNDSRIPTIITQIIFFFLENCSLAIWTPQRDGGMHLCLVQWCLSTRTYSITDTSETVFSVSCCTGPLPSHTKMSSATQDHVCILTAVQSIKQIPYL